MITLAAVTVFTAFADADPDAKLNKSSSSIALWGFANYGVYSGYQLYGSLVNKDPTLQGYAEENANVAIKGLDLGYFGVGVWCNSDLTGERVKSGNQYRRAFNEFDFNLHWGRTFWFDDDNTVGLAYRTSVVWYWYPHFGYSGEKGRTFTTFDWNHYFELVNPIVVPYLNVVHEYHESNGNLLQFGLKRNFQITDNLSLCPFIEGVWRNRNYCWCFNNYGNEPDFSDKIGAGLATVKAELDATYMFNANIGIFAKVAYCQVVDPNLREAVGDYEENRGVYGCQNEFAWGGFGVCVNF